MKQRRNNILQIFWTDAHFHEMVPNFSHFTDTHIMDEEGFRV
jgi:hypothetical protein